MHLPAQLQVVFVNPTPFPGIPLSPLSVLSGVLQSLLLQLTHLFSTPWSPCLPFHLASILLYVSRGVSRCQEQNPSFLELQTHRFSFIPFPRPVGTQPLELGQFCGRHPRVAGVPLFRVPKEHLTRQLGLLQHHWSERFWAPCSTLFFLLKKWAKATFLLHQAFPPQQVLFVHLLPGELWSSDTWAPAAQLGTTHTECCCRWGWQCYFLVGSRNKRTSLSRCICGFHQVLCLRLRCISDVQDGAPDSCYSSQKLRATACQCCTVSFLHRQKEWIPATFAVKVLFYFNQTGATFKATNSTFRAMRIKYLMVIPHSFFFLLITATLGISFQVRRNDPFPCSIKWDFILDVYVPLALMAVQCENYMHLSLGAGLDGGLWGCWDLLLPGAHPCGGGRRAESTQAVSRHCSNPVRIPLLACASVSLQRRKPSWVCSWPCTEGQCDPSTALLPKSLWTDHIHFLFQPAARCACTEDIQSKGWCIFSKLFVCETFLLTCLFNLLQLFFLVDSPQYSFVPSTGLNIVCFLRVKPQLYSFFTNYELTWFLASYKHKNVTKNPTGWV